MSTLRHTTKAWPLTFLVLALLLALSAPWSAGPASADPAIKINEVESNGGVPGDWVELINTGSSAVDVSNYVFKDNDDTHIYVIPAGTIIPAGAYKVLDELISGVGNFSFGLGAADSARLFEPGGTVIVDTYSWTAHAAVTYGRCPNGTGAFVSQATSTKGAANDCSVPVKINEVESNGGVPGDWVELINNGASPVDLSNYIFKDNDDTHSYAIPAGTSIAAGAYLVLNEVISGVGEFNFGLGGADSARLFQPDGLTIVDTYSWTAHAALTYGRCPNGTGTFVNQATSTRGATNDCGTVATTIKVNEVESNGGTPGDWVELLNTGSSAVDLSGYIFKDNDDTHSYVIPGGTSIAAGAYLVLNEVVSGVGEFNFGLGAADSARLFAPNGTTLVDSYDWTAHATTTYGRCPNGSGAFTTTQASTKGALNFCPGDVLADPWPGAAAITTADANGVLGGNMSGLTYEASGTAATGVLWAVKNGPGTLYRLLWNGSVWTPDTANGWGAGKAIHYGDGLGNVDAEGVTLAGSPAGGIYVSSERNNDNNGVSRNSILRLDQAAAGTSLNALNEWNLTADLPVVGPNLGLEAITWVPDAFLVSQGFFDESKNHLYNPAEYANHAGGIFFVGVEANGVIYGFALNHSDNTFTRVATINSGYVGVMDLQFDRELHNLWAACDDGCTGRTAIFEVDATGHFVATQRFERPGSMPNLNNEGFAFASQMECVDGLKAAFWSDDSNTGGNALRQGKVSCTIYPDDDNDGIEDGIDPQPATAGNNSFSDLPFGGSTAGSITDANGHAIDVTDLAGPAGVKLQVGASVEADPATVKLTDKPATISLAQGTYFTTDPDQTTTVQVPVGGPATISFLINGTPVTIVVAAGGSVTYTETTNTSGQLTNLKIDAQSGGVSVSAGDLPQTACSGIQVQNIILGTNGNETINGTSGNDLILAKGGNDTVNGNGGDDCIDAGEGNDRVVTLGGNDIVYAGGGNNNISAGGGNNKVVAGAGNDNITTGSGADSVNAGGGNNNVRTGDGPDQVTTGASNDSIDCGADTDSAKVGGGNNSNVANRCESFLP